MWGELIWKRLRKKENESQKKIGRYMRKVNRITETRKQI